MTKLTDKLTRAALSLPEGVVSNWPGPLGSRLRVAYWKQRLGGVGERCRIDVGVVIRSPEHVFLGDDVWLDCYAVLIAGPPWPGPRVRTLPNPAFRGVRGQIHIGDRVHIAPHTIVQGHGGVSIGKDVTLAAHAMVFSYSHHYWGEGMNPDPDDYASVPKYAGGAPPEQQSMIEGAVEIGDASAVLAGSVVTAGSSVGRYSVIGAGSVVQGRVPPGVIAQGSPLRVVKQRFGRVIDDGDAR
jgi:acetyltransferase-like isoleucine patch superfamily enzyme